MIYDFVKSQYRFIYKTFLLLFFFVITYLFLKENGWKKARDKMLGLIKQPWVLLFLLYISYLLSATVVGRYYKNPYGLVFSNFGIRINDPVWNEDIRNNIVLFVPLTFLHNQCFKPKKVFITDFLISLYASVFIELSQLIGWLGSFQLADIVHNIIGGMIGCGIWCLINKLVSKKDK